VARKREHVAGHGSALTSLDNLSAPAVMSGYGDMRWADGNLVLLCIIKRDGSNLNSYSDHSNRMCKTPCVFWYSEWGFHVN